MTTMCAKDFPPPIRKQKRRLSLKTAIATMSQSESAMVRPLLDPLGEFPSVTNGRQIEIEENLIELQANIIIREGLLADQEKKLHYRERELNEREALLEAHQKILRSSVKKIQQSKNGNATMSTDERRALEALKKELLLQENSLKEARGMLQEREDYIVQCENELVEKSMQLTEREAHVEQREEDHEARKLMDSKIS